MLAKRDVKNRYASSYAGIAWSVGVTLLYSLINVVVFSVLMKGRMGARYGDVPFALFYFVPFSLWSVFAEVVARSTGILREYAYLINKIAFPSWVLPLVPLASALLSQLILWTITAVLMVHFGVPPASSCWVFVLVWLIALTMTVGVAYGVSAIAVYVPDLTHAIPVCTTILFWLTPVLYPATLVEDHGALWLRSIIMTFNPFSYVVELARYAVFGSAAISWAVVGTMGMVALLIFSVGFFVFFRLQPGFADVV
jgi:ABC-type polysaccharide/polyol phosphate export permease